MGHTSIPQLDESTTFNEKPLCGWRPRWRVSYQQGCTPAIITNIPLRIALCLVAALYMLPFSLPHLRLSPVLVALVSHVFGPRATAYYPMAMPATSRQFFSDR